MPKITPCLWFDTEGERAARFYTSVVRTRGSCASLITVGLTASRRDGDGGRVRARQAAVRRAERGPDFTFDEAVSFQVACATQDEVDTYWSTLSEGGEEGPCGWLKDRYGVSWQIVPTRLHELLADPDRDTSQRVMAAMLQMRKLDIAGLARRGVDARAATRRALPPTGSSTRMRKCRKLEAARRRR